MCVMGALCCVRFSTQPGAGKKKKKKEGATAIIIIDSPTAKPRRPEPPSHHAHHTQQPVTLITPSRPFSLSCHQAAGRQTDGQLPDKQPTTMLGFILRHWLRSAFPRSPDRTHAASPGHFKHGAQEFNHSNFLKHLTHERRLKTGGGVHVWGCHVPTLQREGPSQQVEHLRNAVEATARAAEGARRRVRLCVNVRCWWWQLFLVTLELKAKCCFIPHRRLFLPSPRPSSPTSPLHPTNQQAAPACLPGCTVS